MFKTFVTLLATAGLVVTAASSLSNGAVTSLIDNAIQLNSMQLNSLFLNGVPTNEVQLKNVQTSNVGTSNQILGMYKSSSQYCQIVFVVNTQIISLPQIGDLPTYMRSYTVFFKAQTIESNPIDVLVGSESDIFSEEELTTLNIKQTPERVALVSQLQQKLIQEGWAYTGHGDYWYNLRFERK